MYTRCDRVLQLPVTLTLTLRLLGFQSATRPACSVAEAAQTAARPAPRPGPSTRDAVSPRVPGASTSRATPAKVRGHTQGSQGDLTKALSLVWLRFSQNPPQR